MKCFVKWLPKTGDADHFTVTIGDETVKGYVSGVSQKIDQKAKASEVVATIRREFPLVNLTDLEFEDATTRSC